MHMQQSQESLARAIAEKAHADQVDLARTVKLADLAHNSDLSRLPEVTETDLRRVEKYRQAIEVLMG